ncbi:MAG: nuoJ [Nitrospira sp.]|jgi:NADH-quinone oxidoreductase subunit J|nr:nuoJ [Nitrospira sp.]
MNALFYITAMVGVISTGMVITRLNAVHALLYLIVSFLAVAMIFVLLGAPFVAALEVIIYAGAIMVLFLFVVMMLNQGSVTVEQERRWLKPGMWAGPSLLSLILLGELLYLFGTGTVSQGDDNMVHVEVKQVSKVLLGPYLIGVELASMLLLPGLVGAYHLGRRLTKAGD